MRRRAALAVGALAVGVLAVPSATAQPPEKTGWWNAVSTPGLAVPQPTTAEGDLRIAGRGTDVLAFAAVLYPTDGSTSATLSVPLREGRTTGTPDVVACPTLDTAWEAGGNQPTDTAPEYDCSLGMGFGLLSEDGTTLDFGLDATQQLESGVWSLALVPNPEASAPFAVELQAPPEDAFTADPPVETSPFAGVETSSDPEPVPADDTTGAEVPFSPTVDAPLDTGSGGGDGSAFAPLLADEAPADLTGALPEEPPLVAADEPVVGTTPTRTVAAAEESGNDATRVLALLALIAVCAYVGHAAGQQRLGPRLLGGRARALAGTAAAAPVTVTGGGAVPLTGRQERPRGIGRFARTRDEPPRGLR